MPVAPMPIKEAMVQRRPAIIGLEEIVITLLLRDATVVENIRKYSVASDAGSVAQFPAPCAVCI